MSQDKRLDQALTSELHRLRGAPRIADGIAEKLDVEEVRFLLTAIRDLNQQAQREKRMRQQGRFW